MPGFLVRTLITAIGLWFADILVPGIVITTPLTLIIAALLMGFINAFVRPLVIILTLPVTLLTLGLFLLIVNAALFGLVAWFLDGFQVSGFLAATFGWIIVSLTAMFASWFIGPDGRYEVILIERR